MASEQLRNNVIVCLSFTSAPLSVDPNALRPAWCASALRGLINEADTCFASTAGAAQPLRPALEAGWSLDSGREVLGLGVPGQGSNGQMRLPSSKGCRADRQATVHCSCHCSCLSCSVDVGGQRLGCLQCGHGSFRVPSDAICRLWFMCSSSRPATLIRPGLSTQGWRPVAAVLADAAPGGEQPQLRHRHQRQGRRYL